MTAPSTDQRPMIRIEPGVRFGRAHISGISCEALAELVMAGDDVDGVADDFGVSRGAVLLACWWLGMEGPPRSRERWRAWAESAYGLLARGAYDEIEDPPEQERLTR